MTTVQGTRLLSHDVWLCQLYAGTIIGSVPAQGLKWRYMLQKKKVRPNTCNLWLQNHRPGTLSLSSILNCATVMQSYALIFSKASPATLNSTNTTSRHKFCSRETTSLCRNCHLCNCESTDRGFQPRSSATQALGAKGAYIGAKHKV